MNLKYVTVTLIVLILSSTAIKAAADQDDLTVRDWHSFDPFSEWFGFSHEYQISELSSQSNEYYASARIFEYEALKSGKVTFPLETMTAWQVYMSKVPCSALIMANHFINENELEDTRYYFESFIHNLVHAPDERPIPQKQEVHPRLIEKLNTLRNELLISLRAETYLQYQYLLNILSTTYTDEQITSQAKSCIDFVDSNFERPDIEISHPN